MSAKIMGGVYDLELSNRDQSVLLAMADHADHEGNNVYPSNGLVAWKLGVSEDTVSRAKKALVAKGILIEISAVAGKVKRYSIRLDAGIKKPPFNPANRRNSSPHYPPQPAGGCNQLPPAELCGNYPPQPAGEPPAELCGTNRLLEPSLKPSFIAPPAPAPINGKKQKKDTDPRHREFVLEWTKEFPHYHEGRHYVFEGDKDAARLKSLLVALPKADVSELIDLAVWAWQQSGKEFWACENRSHDIAGFATSYNKIMREMEVATAPPKSQGPGHGNF